MRCIHCRLARLVCRSDHHKKSVRASAQGSSCREEKMRNPLAISGKRRQQQGGGNVQVFKKYLSVNRIMPFLQKRRASHKILLLHWSFFLYRNARDARQTGPPRLPNSFSTPPALTNAFRPVGSQRPCMSAGDSNRRGYLSLKKFALSNFKSFPLISFKGRARDGKEPRFSSGSGVMGLTGFAVTWVTKLQG